MKSVPPSTSVISPYSGLRIYFTSSFSILGGKSTQTAPLSSCSLTTARANILRVGYNFFANSTFYSIPVSLNAFNSSKMGSGSPYISGDTKNGFCNL